MFSVLCMDLVNTLGCFVLNPVYHDSKKNNASKEI